MIKIRIGKENKSIPAGLEFEIPNFTVLTGENGSGKTQLFESISAKECSVHLKDTQLLQRKYIPFNGLNPNANNQCGVNQINSQIDRIWNEIHQNQNALKTKKQLWSDTNLTDDPVYRRLRLNTITKSLVERIYHITGKLPLDLTQDDISEHFSFQLLQNDNVLTGQFAEIFKTYHIHYLDNKLNKVYIEDKIEDARPYLEEKEFENIYGKPPWEFVNAILSRLKLPYEVNNPMGNKRDSHFIFKLIHKEDKNINIDLKDLSTGEKTLMSLALILYNTDNVKGIVDLLILDEPDASLHPSMSNIMLDILEEEIVTKFNVPVIMSTHSPTTIALAPANSLYKISKENKIPEHCSLDDTINILSYGIPNFKVSIESRRQVFVESRLDVRYYELLYKIVCKYKKDELYTDLHFLSPHDRDGSNCEDVKTIVDKLSGMGNTNVYGLIDWDTKNESTDKIIVLGQGKRYAIENYIFEPHILGLYLCYKNFISPIDVGLEGCDSFLQVADLIRQDNTKLQTIVDKVEQKLEFSVNDTFNSELIDGTVLTINQQYQEMNGHQLEEKIKNCWIKLKSVRSNNGGDSELKLDIIKNIINIFPGLISIDILETLKKFK